VQGTENEGDSALPTFSGFNSNFQLDLYPSDIRSALRRIADDFYVTRSFQPVFIGNSQYYGALVRPTDETSVYLNTERELIVLFSRYETFEIRTLEAYREFYSLLDSARVDESIRFLISADAKIDEHIRHYLEQHPEYPIIVPLTFDALMMANNPLIRSVQKNYLVRDLFGFLSPLREEHFFFGRNETVSCVIDFAKSGQHSSLFGLRKSGKTSTIFAIQRKSKSVDLNVVVIDCQDLAVHGRRYGELLIWIITRIRSAYNLKTFSPPAEASGPSVSEWFSRSMKATLDGLKSNLLLVFDEIENISPKTAASSHWRNGIDATYFWQILRSFSQIQHKRRVSVCVVGTSPYLLEASKIGGIDNPAYLLASKKFIPNLTFDETREMVTRLGFFMGLNFSAQAIAKLHASYGGHPFFTRQVCSKIHQLTSLSRPTDVPLSRLAEAQRQFSSQLEQYLGDIISNLRDSYPEEFSLLRDLILGERSELDEYLNEVPDLVDHLIGYGLIVERDGIFEVAFDAVRSAVLKIEPISSGESSLEQKWSEVCVRRNTIEQSLRTAIYYWTKTVDPTLWQTILDRELTARRLDALSSREPAVLLAKGNSPLYLTDLLAIIKDDRVIPHLEERRSIILGALNTLNGLRKDAHANDITDAEYRKASDALSLLETEFVAP
jgi:hypothetical protein